MDLLLLIITILLGPIGIILGIIAFFRTSHHKNQFEEIEYKIKELNDQLTALKQPSTTTGKQVAPEDKRITSSDTLNISHTRTELEQFNVSELEAKGQENSHLQSPYQQNAIPDSLAPIFNWLKENWTGFLGVSILVLGVIFGTVYLSYFASPFFRFLILVSVGFAFLPVAIYLRQKTSYQELAGWLQSASGAVILFACVATGFISALHFYQSPIIGLGLVFSGLLYNIILAFVTAKQSLSCLHVVISLLALMVVPKETVVFVAAMAVTLSGITLSIRHAWNINLFVTYFAFAIFHYLWHEHSLMSLSNIIFAIIGTCIVGVVALLVHYKQTYQHLDTKKNLFTHVSIWLLFAAQLAFYNTGFPYLYVPLGIATSLSFGLALYAKKKSINWLFICDTIVAQILAMITILSLTRIDFNHEYIAWLAFNEALVFYAISYRAQQILLSKVGLFFCVSSFIALCITVLSIPEIQLLYIAVATLVPLYGVRCFVANDTKNSDDISPLLMDVMLYFFAFYILLLVPNYPYTYIVLMIALLANTYNSSLMKQEYHKIAFLVFNLVMVLYAWLQIPYAKNDIDRIVLYGIPEIILLAQFFKRKTFYLRNQYNIEDLGVYLLGLHLAFTSSLLTLQYSVFLPGIGLLILGILFFESSQQINNRYQTSRAFFLSAACQNIAVLFLVGYFALYVLMYLPSEVSIIPYASITHILTILALLISLFWYFSQKSSPLAFSEFNARITMRILTLSQEMPFELALTFALFLLISIFTAPIHPIGYALLSIALSIPLFRTYLPQRALTYAICLVMATCIQVAVVSSQWASPLSDWYQSTHITGPLSMLIATAAAYFLLTKPENLKNTVLQIYYRNPVLIGFLPIFIALALFLLWRFDKAYLTLLWVIEILGVVVLGYLLKSKSLVHIAFGFLAFCVARLITYDLAQSDLLLRALVFVVVGILMIFIHMIYKKYAGRLQ